MFGAIILTCSLDYQQCLNIGGPVYKTEVECVEAITSQGIQYVLENYPDHTPVDYQCVYWEALEELDS